MTETPVPDAAYQRALDENWLRNWAHRITTNPPPPEVIERVLAEVAALRAELAAADETEAERKVECPGPNCPASFVSRVPFEAERQLVGHHRQAHPHPLLDALQRCADRRFPQVSNYPAPPTTGAAASHNLDPDPPAAATAALRWTCRDCGDAVLDYHGTVYGPAVERACSKAITR